MRINGIWHKRNISRIFIPTNSSLKIKIVILNGWTCSAFYFMSFRYCNPLFQQKLPMTWLHCVRSLLLTKRLKMSRWFRTKEKRSMHFFFLTLNYLLKIFYNIFPLYFSGMLLLLLLYRMTQKHLARLHKRLLVDDLMRFSLVKLTLNLRWQSYTYINVVT